MLGGQERNNLDSRPGFLVGIAIQCSGCDGKLRLVVRGPKRHAAWLQIRVECGGVLLADWKVVSSPWELDG